MVVRKENMGFRIDNINFRQAVAIPAGEYSFYMKVKPTGTSMQFGYLLEGESAVTTVDITDLTANELQEVHKTFTTSGVMIWFYPARQLNAEIHELTLNKGDKAIEPQPHPLDSKHYSESRLQILRDEISLKVSNAEMESAINQKSDEINLAVDNLKDDLEATGFNITDKKIKVVADKFEVYDNNGTPRAIFSENFKLDQYGNVELASVKTPIVDLVPAVSGNNLIVDWSATPNIILKSRPKEKGVINLPTTQEYNGRQLIVVHDMFWAGNSGATVGFMDLKAGTYGMFLGEGFDGRNYIRMHSDERFVMKITGVWNSSTGRLNWAITDFADYTTYKTRVKAGEVLYSGYIDTNGNLTQYYKHVKFILNGDKVSNRLRLQVGQILRVDSAGNNVVWSPIINYDLFLKVASNSFTRTSYISSSIWELITFQIIDGAAPMESVTPVYFEITATRDIDLRNG